MTAGAGLEVAGLRVSYRGGAVGVENVELRCGYGEVVALVGPNGGGKSSTLRAIAGFAASETGVASAVRLRLDEKNLSGLSPLQRMRRGIVLVPERDKIFPALTVHEHLRLTARGRGHARASLIDEIEARFEVLGAHRARRAGHLSGGQRQLLAIASALCMKPKLLLVDELTLGLAPVAAHEVARIIEELAGDGLGVVFSDQSTLIAKRLATRSYVFDAGRMLQTSASGDHPVDSGESKSADSWDGR
ncbi:MAG TPA: ATP-binding cassette domain-containing protein [Mycobacteriales bacterium]|jgi:ABC-type branched-subunit amino acid transport system ATPase component|nr:ATP-binding cassette domain-containing protein [Mycobacteriales bacterium]